MSSETHGPTVICMACGATIDENIPRTELYKRFQEGTCTKCGSSHVALGLPDGWEVTFPRQGMENIVVKGMPDHFVIECDNCKLISVMPNDPEWCELEATTMGGLITEPEGHNHDVNRWTVNFICDCGHNVRARIRRKCGACDWIQDESNKGPRSQVYINKVTK